MHVNIPIQLQDHTTMPTERLVAQFHTLCLTTHSVQHSNDAVQHIPMRLHKHTNEAVKTGDKKCQHVRLLWPMMQAMTAAN